MSAADLAIPAGATPYRSQQPDAGDGFGLLLRAEWTKFRSVRGWVIGLVVAALVTLGLSVFSASGSNSSICNPGPGGVPVCTGMPPLPKGPGGVEVTDAYSYQSQPLAGDGSLTLRVAALSGVEATGNSIAVQAGGGPQPGGTAAALAPWAKAGILVTSGTSPGSAYAAVMVTGGHGVRLQYDYTHDLAAGGAAGARWLRLTRQGGAVTGYQSSDGTNWSRIATVHVDELPTAGTVRIGMFVTSPVAVVNGSNARPSEATATFDDVTLEGPGSSTGWSQQIVGGSTSYPTLPIPKDSAFTNSGSTFTATGSGDIAPAVGGGIFGGFGLENTLTGAFGGLIVFVVLAALFITSEYRRALIRTTFSATPNRTRVLVAKAAVIAAVTFVATVPAVAVAMVIGRRLLLDHGNVVFPAGILTMARVVGGTAAVFALAAVLSLAIGTILRRSAGAVVAGIVLLVVPFVLAAALPAGATQWLMRLTPAAGFAIQQTLPRYAQVSAIYTPSNGYYPLSPWVGLAVLAAFAALALVAAAAVLRRRDV